ncbi:uncharacterized protein LOC106761632 isoform X1 [Vigna radiata var. radiata]|uniref:Uncharacterized protein LOC106761632 isoform X1 n=2 Tax=Vigna TaxID=3913 RepID=A0A3Q0EXY2_VIGRR|nr:uncharacterized protein LOC106761632 isoform X1 [Vigna radiata var. radiata]
MATMSLTVAAPSLSFPSTPSLTKLHSRVLHIKPLHCTPIHQQHVLLLFFAIIEFIQLKSFIHLICLFLIKVDADAAIMCEPCNGKGWLVCDFCKGQKTNIKAENKRIYRRCPSCKAVGYVLCSNCKVFKCVTFPNFEDSQN